MDRLSAALIVAVTAISVNQIATAADLPTKAPAPAVVAPYNWYGFYIGVQGGYAGGREAINLTPDANYAPSAAAGLFPTSFAGDPRGGLGGIQFGSNWQYGRFVVGTASDFSFSNINASQTSFVSSGRGGVTTLGTQKLEWLSTSRVRAGYTVADTLLLYGTGGLADGRASASSSIVMTGCGAGACPAGSDAKTLWGWAAGGGAEYAMGRWSVNVEYIHYDLGHLNYNMTDPTLPGAFIAASTKYSGDIVRGGISYRFDWTPWEFIFGRRS
jgi:outer membrane immunogenic protein